MAASLALTAAMAQQDEPQGTPAGKKKQQHQQQGQQAQPQQPQEQAQRPGQQRRQQRQDNRGARREQRTQRSNQPATAEGTHDEQKGAHHQQVQQQPQVNANAQAEQHRNRHEESNRQGTAAEKSTTKQTAKGETNANVAAQTNEQRTAKANKGNAKVKKPDVQTVQRVKEQHTNFHAQAKPQNVPAVTFNQSYRITNAEHWQGPQYVAFRQYRPAWHERSWWHSHFNTIVLIGGGYYYWDNGYWYPAWGYEPSASYYVYNGPIYTGSQSLPPDQVVANVQAILQDMGYYRGEVDGLLGPLTREALTAYQADNGLYTTAAIDQPTLDSLGLEG